MHYAQKSRADRPLWLEVHPLIRRVAVALAIWSLAAIWLLFSHSYYGPLLFGVVTFLVAMFGILPWTLMRVDHEPHDRPVGFREWARGRFDTGSGPISAGEAAVMILLIPAAVAVGITVFGLFDYLTASSILH